MVYLAAGLTDVGCLRTHNEDACFAAAFSGGCVGVVCDGMGGANAGEVASRIALESFLDVLQSRSEPMEERIRIALEQANQAVFCHGWEHPECRGMGTTLVAAVVMGTTAYVLNVGDSRAYAVNEEGLLQITRDHSLVEELVRAGQITPEEARVHPRRNIITRALGADRLVEGDLYIYEMTPGERLLLCSDGLSGELPDEELEELARRADTMEDGCRTLVDAAVAQGARDNVTAVLLQAGACTVE